eukprot:scaffold79290_cov41-Attheya_sp.AAC.5
MRKAAARCAPVQPSPRLQHGCCSPHLTECTIWIEEIPPSFFYHRNADARCDATRDTKGPFYRSLFGVLLRFCPSAELAGGQTLFRVTLSVTAVQGHSLSRLY